MNKIKTIIKTVCLIGALSCAVQAAELDNDWVLTLSGNGGTQTTGAENTSFGTEFSLGKTGKILLPIELGLRQSLSYTDANDDGGNLVAGTKFYSDWTLFTVSRVDLFAGGNFGARYGNTPLTWSVSPEAGLRFKVRDGAYIVGRVEYPYDINPGHWADVLVYTLGVRINF